MCTIPDIRATRPRQLGNWAARFSYTPHPPPDPSGSRPPRAPWCRGRSPESRQARPPKTAPPCRYNFSLLGDGVRRRPTLPVPRCDTGHPAQRAQGARTRLQGGTVGTSYRIRSRPARAPRLKPNSSPARSLRDARTTITHSGHTFTLDSALSSETSLTPSRDSITRTQLISTQPLILTHNASTHSHSLTQTHPLTHSHASTHLPLTLTHWRCVSMRTSLGVVERVA
jgi:hypothetical protein